MALVQYFYSLKSCFSHQPISTCVPYVVSGSMRRVRACARAMAPHGRPACAWCRALCCELGLGRGTHPLCGLLGNPCLDRLLCSSCLTGTRLRAASKLLLRLEGLCSGVGACAAAHRALASGQRVGQGPHGLETRAPGHCRDQSIPGPFPREACRTTGCRAAGACQYRGVGGSSRGGSGGGEPGRRLLAPPLGGAAAK